MNQLQLTNYIPIYTRMISKVQTDLENKIKERDELVRKINQEYIDVGLSHIIHLREDGTINYDGCCRSCLWHP